MPRTILSVLVIALVGAAPQAALAKGSHRHAKHARHAAHARHSGAKRSVTSLSDPTTQISDPTTQITDPTTQITDPGTQLPAPPPTGNPAQLCRAEQDDPGFADAHNGEDFAHFYGTNPNLRNAFGKCVSGHAQDQNGQDDQGSDDQGGDAAGSDGSDG